MLRRFGEGDFGSCLAFTALQSPTHHYLTVTVRFIGVAGANFSLPSCVAVSVTRPLLKAAALDPSTLRMFGSLLVTLTGSLELEVVRRGMISPTFALALAVKAML